ncbi:MAG: hypothetical protein MJA82_09250 [Clostridia bacterium]|nr:hypothetical protein [Clostridia bacterium]
MLIAIIYSFILTVFIGFIVESFKLNFYLKNVESINLRIKKIISNTLIEKSNFDIFTINLLRKIFNEEFLNTNIVDNYELYKIDDFKIKVRYFKGYILEELEILAVDNGVELIEINKEVVE